MSGKKLSGRWTSYKIRKRYSVHERALRDSDILLGETYYDGGYGRRAHEECVKGLTFAKLARDIEADGAGKR